MAALTLELATELLTRCNTISAWQVSETRARSTQRYTVFTRDEARRNVETTKLTVTVHVLHHHDGATVLGESSFVLGPTATRDDLQREVAAARERALLVHNQPYELPSATTDVAPVLTVDDRVVEDAQGVVHEITQNIRSAASQHPGLELSSAEVFATYSRTRVMNSRGLMGTRSDTDLLVEYVLLARDNHHEEHEIWQSPRARLLGDLKIDDHIRRYVTYTRDSLRAQLPRTGTFDVVLGEEALDTLWQFFTAQADASAKYDGWSRFTPGAPVVPDPVEDLLTLVSDPTLPGGLMSASIDAAGQPCLRTVLIEDNIFKNYVATKKYADLTGVPPTGPLGNVVVKPGNTGEQQMLQSSKPVYQLLRFSTFAPSPTSGAFSGEIRTGYLFEDGKCTPIKGGSVSGHILNAFRRALFSREVTRREAYQGPSSVLLGDLTITG